MPRADPRWKDESHPRSGVEFDWLGVDLQGHVAVFTTAGFGPVPMQVDQHLDDVDAALDRVGQLPVIGSAGDIGRRSADGDYSDWAAYSAKGFYAYDWEDQTGSCRRPPKCYPKRAGSQGETCSASFACQLSSPCFPLRNAFSKNLGCSALGGKVPG